MKNSQPNSGEPAHVYIGYLFQSEPQLYHHCCSHRPALYILTYSYFSALNLVFFGEF